MTRGASLGAVLWIFTGAGGGTEADVLARVGTAGVVGGNADATAALWPAAVPARNESARRTAASAFCACPAAATTVFFAVAMARPVIAIPLRASCASGSATLNRTACVRYPIVAGGGVKNPSPVSAARTAERVPSAFVISHMMLAGG